MKEASRYELMKQAERRERRALIESVVEATKAGRTIEVVDLTPATEAAQDKRNRVLEETFEASIGHPSEALAELIGRLECNGRVLNIDRVIEQRAPLPRAGFRRFPIAYTKRVARRMIHVAYSACEMQKYASSKNNAATFNEVARRSQAASEALDSLMNILARDPFSESPAIKERSELLRPLLTAQAREYARTETRKKALPGRVNRQAAAFWLARVESKKLATRCRDRHHELAATAKNEQAKHETAFALVLFDAWQYLTGGRASTKDDDSAPFLVFARAAWRDAYCSDRSRAAWLAKYGTPHLTDREQKFVLDLIQRLHKEGFATAEEAASLDSLCERVEPVTPEEPRFYAAVGYAPRPSPNHAASEFTCEDCAHAAALAVSRKTRFGDELSAIIRDKPVWL